MVSSGYNANGKLLATKLIAYTGDPNSPSAAVDQTIESRAYDPAGRLARVTDAKGNQTLYRYTDNNLESKVTRTDLSGNTTFVQDEVTYDGAGNVLTRKTNNGVTLTTYGIDAAGRIVSSILDPGGLARTATQTLSPDDYVLNTTLADGTGVLSTTDNVFDAAGQVLATASPVSPALAPYGRWRLDETSGTAAGDSIGNSRATGAAGLTWSTDHGGSAVLNGATSLATSGPAVDTTRSFTVSAWVKIASPGASSQTAVSQDGTRRGGFGLGYDGSTNRWRLYRCQPNVDGACVTALSTAAPAAGTWTHLSGVFDRAAGRVKLYVNGALQGDVAMPGSWDGAAGPLRIGGDTWNGAVADLWTGSIDDVQVYQKALTATDVTGVVGGTIPAADAGVVRTSWKRDQSGLATAETDPRGNTTDFSLDEAGRVAVIAAPAVSTETGGGAPIVARPVTYTGYNTFGETVEAKDANGNVTVVGYDGAGRPTSLHQPTYTRPGTSTPITAVSSRAYDDAGQLLTDTDPLSHVTTYVHDQLGRVAKVTAPDAGVSKYGYDLSGNPTARTDPTGAVTQATFDYLDRRVTSKQVVRQTGLTHTTTYSFDDSLGGFPSLVQSAGGVISSATYDHAGRQITSRTGPDTTGYTYDGLGQLVKTTLPDLTYRTVTYDMAGRATQSRTYDPANVPLATVKQGYDAAGNVVAATDARNTVSTFTYDATGRLTSEVQPISGSDSIATSFGYDLAGNRTRFTDGRNNPFVTTYNTWELPESQIEPTTTAYPSLAQRTFTAGYDAAGRVFSVASPGGVSTTNSYDNVGRLIGQTGTGAEIATTARTLGYDLAGRLTTATGPGGLNTFGYDDRGLLLTTAGGSGTSSFAYNADANMTSRIDAAGTTTYHYDTSGRLDTATNTAASLAATISYNSLSQPNRITYGTSGNARWLGYNTSHRLTSDELKTPGGTSIAKVAYDWDANGNEKLKTTTGFTGAASNVYTYDLANRLISWTNGATPTVYAYDKSGNRTQAGSNLFTYDERNQLKTKNGSVLFSYTARGTLASTSVIGVSTLATTTDAFGQIRSQGYSTTQHHDYDYDALGRLVRTGAPYSGAGNTLAADGSTTYIRDGGGALIGQATGAAAKLAWTDRHSDVVAMFDATTATLAAYDPLGKVLSSVGTMGSLGYQGEYTDTATGRVNMAARWYNTDTGQFDSRDSADLNPAPASGHANRFAYADANPLTNTDPTGHMIRADGEGGGWEPPTIASMGCAYTGDCQSSGEQSQHVWPVIRVGGTGETVHRGCGYTGDCQASGHVSVKATVMSDNAYRDAVQQELRAQQAAMEASAAQQKREQECQASWTCRHASLIGNVVGAAVGIVVGTVVGSACMAATLGIGSIGCAALAGFVGGFTGGFVGSITGSLLDTSRDHSVVQVLGGALLDGAIGGVAGVLGGAIGGKVAGSLLKTAAGGLLSRIGVGVAVGALSGAGSGALTGGAYGALEYAQSCGDGCNFADGARATAAAAARGAATSAVLGGALGGVGGGLARGCHSFAPGTRVLMADGSTRPIEDVNVGDTVKAADPVAGTTESKPVTALHLNRDTELTDVTVASSGVAAESQSTSGKLGALVGAAVAVAGLALGAVAALHTTDHHQFWDQTTSAWTTALKLGTSMPLWVDSTRRC